MPDVSNKKNSIAAKKSRDALYYSEILFSVMHKNTHKLV